VRNGLLCVGAFLTLVGCHSSPSDDTALKLPAGAGQPLNPTGKMTPQQQATADKIQANALKAEAGRAAAMRAGTGK
jgi:hypothetical protein